MADDIINRTADWEPGTLDKTRKNIGDISKKEADIMAKKLVTDLDSFVKIVSKQLSFSFALRGDSAETIDAKLVGIAFSWSNEESFYLPFPINNAEAQSYIEKIKPIFASCSTKITYDAKYSISILLQHNPDSIS